MRSFEEIRFRIGQCLQRGLDRSIAARNCVFRDGRMNLKHPALREISAYLESKEQETAEDRFFRSVADFDCTRRIFRECFGGSEADILAGARLILNREFPIFGRNLSYGNPPSWHFDPLSRKSAPFKYHSDIDFLDFRRYGDHKVIWELNRHQYMLILAKAFWLSGDERYLLEWVLLMENWMKMNPPPIGINWASSLEIAYRSIAWIWCWFFFRKSRLLSDHFRLRFMLYLYTAGTMIEKNLSRYFSPNTHLTGEALGLVYLGILFAGLKRGEAWQKRGTNILLEQLERHVRVDGSYMEQSTWYHKYTTDIYLHFAILLKANSLLVPSPLLGKIRDLLDFILLTNKPDGTAPVVGDDDGGALLPLAGGEPRDFRGVLSTGAVLFGREDYKTGSGDYAEETLWLLGPSSRGMYDGLGKAIPKEESAAFPEGGYYVMRNGWKPDSDYMLIDCGPHGWLNGGHAHSDLNSICASVRGREVLVDPGTYTYGEAGEWRNYFRTSQAHNTVAVDGLSQSLPAGPFSWIAPGRPESVRWISRKEMDYFAGTASLYRYLGSPVRHAREILFLKKERFWVIRDRIESGKSRELAVLFHFPDTAVRLEGTRFILQNGSGPCASVFVQADPEPGLFMTDDWISPVYARKTPAKTGVCQVRADRAVFMTVIEGGPGDGPWDHLHMPSGDCLRRLDRSGRPPAEIKFIDEPAEDGQALLFEEDGKIRCLGLDCVRFTAPGLMTVRFADRVDHVYLETDGPAAGRPGVRVRFSPAVDYEYEALDRRIIVDIQGEPCAVSAARR